MEMHWHWPQIVFAGMMMMGLGLSLERHGVERKSTENVFVSMVAQAFIFWILYKGGFWG